MAKQIEIPKPTKVPDNWCWVAMGKLTAMKSGYPFDSHRFVSEPSDTTRPLIRIRDVVRGSTETFTDEECPDEYIITRGEILIGMDGDFNVAKWLSADALLNQRVCCIKSSSSLYLDDFLFYYLPDPLKKINDATPSVTVKHLSTKTLAITPVPVPPLAEQRRIVERIESLFAKLDEAKEKAQLVLDSFETRKAAILHKAFTGELTAKWRAEHGVNIDGWQQTTIGKESLLITKGASPRWQGITYTDDKSQTLFVTSENVRDGYLDLTKEKYLDNRINEIQRRSVLQRGDVLVNIVGASIGRAAIFDLECLANTNQAVCLVRLKGSIVNRFLCYYLNSPVALTYYGENKVETARANISLTNISDMGIALPSIAEQHENIRILDSLFAKEQQAKEAAEAVLEQIDLLKKSILARAFRGELGTNDPNEESAVELLKEVIC